MILTAQEEYGIRCALTLARAQALMAGSLPLAHAFTSRTSTLVFVHVVERVEVGVVDRLADEIREQVAAAPRSEQRTHLVVGASGADLAGLRALVADFNQAAWVEPWSRHARARLGVIDRNWGTVEADRAYAGTPSLMRMRLPIPARSWPAGRAEGLHVEDLRLGAAAA